MAGRRKKVKSPTSPHSPFFLPCMILMWLLDPVLRSSATDEKTPDSDHLSLDPTGGSFARCGGWIAVWKWGMQSSSKIDWMHSAMRFHDGRGLGKDSPAGLNFSTFDKCPFGRLMSWLE